MDTAGERKGGMNWEIRTDVDTLPWASLASPALLVGSLPLVPPGKPWKIASLWELAIKHRTLSSMLCNDLGGWVVGRGEDVEGRSKRKGIYVCIWLIHFIVYEKPTQYRREIIFQ